MSDIDEALARTFHEAYERLAPSYGYETRQETRKFDPHSANGQLMVAVCGEVRAALGQRRVVAQPAQWEHEIFPSGGQKWTDQRYGFVIEYDHKEDPEFRYHAAWGLQPTESFPTLNDAKSWCQDQVDDLIRDWAMLAAAPSPESDDGLS